MVEHFYVFEYSQCCLCTCSEVATVYQLLLQCREEALSHTIVPTTAFTTHAADDAVLLKALTIAVGRVGASSVRGVYQSLGGAAHRDCRVQCSQSQVLIIFVTTGQTDHFPVEQTYHGSDIQPAFVSGHSGDIAYPHVLRLSAGEIPLDHVWRHRVRLVSLGRVAIALARLHGQVIFTHQPSNPIVADRSAFNVQLTVDTRAAIGPAAVLEDATNVEIYRQRAAKSRQAASKGKPATRATKRNTRQVD